MAIWIGEDAKVLVQGITRNQGTFHATKSAEFGANVVGGVTPGKGGQIALEGRVPVFNSMLEAKKATSANASIIFVPPR